ncbi:MAG: PEP/pyruvate-binding domain-containing protein [Bacteroidales bacterium]|nr:PEP/pyruvate-binding domain-containing protein [Bacteroidales bacterium]MDZ4204117.1 PEP/pyruvate-binding domain-containing protein [Bacteroidales bacterium]
MNEDNKQDVSRQEIDKLLFERRERLKELAAINRTTQILKENKPVDETLQHVCMILPSAWQYPEFTTARIRFDGKEYHSSDFEESEWIQRQGFITIDEQPGSIEIFYTRKFMDIDEGPFMSEERMLIENLANILTGYLNSISAKAILSQSYIEERFKPPAVSRKAPMTPSKQLLQRFLNKNNANRDIYHDLMPFKVREILLVANLYDAYSIEREGRFSEHVLGEYAQLNLTSVPRITGVSSPDEVFAELQLKHYDLIIFMIGVDKKLPVELSHHIKIEYPYIPIYFLLNGNRDVEYFSDQKNSCPDIDRLFIWNGESQMFFAMIKHLEDRINAENDTRVGMVRMIVLVEDSPQYYSRYLPILYNIVMEQTKRIIDDVSTDELYKVLRMRARPKILLASNYEEAVEILDKYREYLLCLITDVKYERNGKMDENAGLSLARYIRTIKKDLPIVIQSSDPANASIAFDLKATFIDKGSETLTQDFRSFIAHYLGFGNFIYRNNQGVQIAIAKSLREFENNLHTIPDESLFYHARKDHFSLWLMARGEIQVARIINPIKAQDFHSPQELRSYLLDVIQKFRNEQNRGKIIPFEESAIPDESNIVSLMEGSLGGKGRGVAFINTLIFNYDFYQHVPNIHVRAPKTMVIGTVEFEYFIDRNHLREIIFDNISYEEIKHTFIQSKLTDTLMKRLKIVLRHIRKPIAIRSSGLFEDSLMQPFAGIFETYLLPNNHPDLNQRVEQVANAIKMVYASIYSNVARGYIEAVNYKLEEEKMAVVLQEVVGHRYGDFFYPHISGVAQSYNYYPFSHMKPEEGFAVAALGLGKYVVDGEKAYRFSPKYAGVEINSPKDIYRNSQVDFFAVDLRKKEPNLLEGDTAGLAKLPISESENHGTLKHLASVYDPESNSISPGLSAAGPRIINFADVLKYNYAPLSKTIETVLDVVKEALGSPVEIEFAVDLNKDKDMRASFYLLQIKPLIGSAQGYNIDLDEINSNDIMLFSEKCMGNGLIETITDVIYVDRHYFDKSQTLAMADEIEKLNAQMIRENRKYLLIGPGRWGTRDRWIGIPVTWPQISNAKVIVETSLESFPLDASSGSHFFHNVTSMNVGYVSLPNDSSQSYIRWEVLDRQPLVQKTTFFRHVRFNKPLKVRMDGKKRMTVITFENGAPC